ncbi:MAG: helix-turn-helix transcriptional regulator [Actinobacteria bacterium]|nr:helix-turn-helix transcriptional regulator [Actinomycetota bacterium]
MVTLTDEQVGAAVRRLREAAGDNQTDLGVVLGVDQATVSRLESGYRSVTAVELLALARHYDVPLSLFSQPEEELVLLRQGEAADEATLEATRIFGRRIDAFFGAKLWAP